MYSHLTHYKDLKLVLLLYPRPTKPNQADRRSLKIISFILLRFSLGHGILTTLSGTKHRKNQVKGEKSEKIKRKGRKTKKRKKEKAKGKKNNIPESSGKLCFTTMIFSLQFSIIFDFAFSFVNFQFTFLYVWFSFFLCGFSVYHFILCLALRFPLWISVYLFIHLILHFIKEKGKLKIHKGKR